MEQTYYDRMSRQTQVSMLLQKAILNLCQTNYASCAPNLEVDGIICISFPNSTDQHVVKIHERVCLNDFGANSFDPDFPRMSNLPKEYDSPSHKGEPYSSSFFGLKTPECRQIDKHSMLDSYNEMSSAKKSRNPNTQIQCPSSTNSPNKTPSRSKRKMFKVVQRIKQNEEPDVLSDCSDETNLSANISAEISSALPMKMNMCHTNDKFNDRLKDKSEINLNNEHGLNSCQNSERSNGKPTYTESLHDGYVIVKVEGCEDEPSIFENGKDGMEKVGKESHNEDRENQQQRKWLQLPIDNEIDKESDTCIPRLQAKDRMITIDGKVVDFSSESPCKNSNDDSVASGDDAYAVRPSIGQIDLSKIADFCKQRATESFDQGTKEFQSKLSPRFHSASLSHSSPYTNDLIQHRQNQIKGIKKRNSVVVNKDHLPDLPNLSPLDCDQSSKNLSVTFSTDKEKKYFCRHCGKGFTLKCTRSRHEKTICGGGGEGQYKCHICLKVFTRSDSRCRHLLKTHGVKTSYEMSAPC